MLTTLVIDDEPLAHDVIEHHLTPRADISIVGHCYSATEALSYLAHHQVDLLILDINMPALSGIELLKVLKKTPQVIIVSAYQEYALQGFELDVTDYLLKPVSAERLLQALDKVRRRIHLQHDASADYIVLKVDREKRKFTLTDIALLEAYGNYVKVWQGEQATLVSCTLKQLVQQLPGSQFVQIHKSFVVNKTHIVAADSDHIRLAAGREVKLGKSFKQCLADLI